MPEAIVPSVEVQMPISTVSDYYTDCCLVGDHITFNTRDGEYTGLVTRIDNGQLTVYIEGATYTYDVPPERRSRWLWLMDEATDERPCSR